MKLANNEAFPVQINGKWFLKIRIGNKTMFRKPTKNAIKKAERKGTDIAEYNGSVFPNISHQHKPQHPSKIDGINLETGKALHTNIEEWKDRFNLFEIKGVIFLKQGQSTLMDWAYANRKGNKDFSILSKVFELQFNKINKIKLIKKREPTTEKVMRNK